MIQLLMGLNPSYETVKSYILTMKPMPTINRALGLLQKAEKQKKISDSLETMGEATAYASIKQSPSLPEPYSKKPKLDDEDDASSSAPDMISGLVDKVVHKVIQALSDGNAQSNAAFTIPSTSFAGISSSSGSVFQPGKAHTNTWIVDSGGSDHMTSCVSLVHDIVHLSHPILVGLPDGSTKLVHRTGTIYLTDNITLYNVLIIPEFKENLLSVGRLLEYSGLKLIFFAHECWFLDHLSRLIVAKAKKHGNLYLIKGQLQNRRGSSHCNCFTSANNVVNDTVVDVTCHLSNSCTQFFDVKLLNQRLGHSSFDKLKHLPGYHMHNDGRFTCHVCMLAKHHKLPFANSNSHAKTCFEWIHLDVWGPYRVRALSGAKSFLTIVDDYTRTTWTFMIQSKEQVSDVLQEHEPTDFSEAQKDERWVLAMDKELQALEANKTWEITELPASKKAIGSKWVYMIKHRSDVAKFATVRALLAIATVRNWPLHQLDINSAFLHVYIDEEVYMRPPLGYTKATNGEVCKLKRTLYGLKQANDLIITGDNENEIKEIKTSPDKAFSIKDLGLMRGLKLSTDQGEHIPDPERYRRLIGRLLYLNLTRPDISYSVQHLSQFLTQPRILHLQSALHVGQCAFSCRSLSGYCVLLGNSLISWKTKKQKTVSKSYAEAEYRCMSYTASEIVWMKMLLKDLNVHVPTHIQLYCDNKAAEHIALNPVFHERTKHLDIDCHYVRERIQEGLIATKHVKSSLQLADLMTKSLGGQQHAYLSERLGQKLLTYSSLKGDCGNAQAQ
ncbi:uncharacterized protein LOC141607127 [Silene latifolia]|uniref:uncharacterized protein LOC141607127 n=1 Tax=Silene latifolia TaxID=37657 RepID=UPI003D789471